MHEGNNSIFKFSINMFRDALVDIQESSKLFPIWTYLAIKDIAAKYKRTLLGPLWVTLNTGIIICGVGIVWSYVLKADVQAYFPYLAAGMIVWNLIAALVSDGAHVFITYSNIIKEVKLPYCVYIFLVVFKNFLLFAHNMLTYVIVAFIFNVGTSFHTLLLIPGLTIFFLAAVFGALLLGMLCSRYADIASSVNSIFGLLFFLTPIVWREEELSNDIAYIAFYNPLTHFVNVIRDPLLNRIPLLSSYVITITCTLLLGSMTIIVFNKYQKRIVGWV